MRFRVSLMIFLVTGVFAVAQTPAPKKATAGVAPAASLTACSRPGRQRQTGNRQ